MPKARFECIDGESIEIKECLEECRLKDRCIPRTMLYNAAYERPFQGKLSVTQLANGTLMEFLRATVPYSVKPSDQSWSLIGTNMHSRMEENRGWGDIAELRVEHPLFYGTIDLLTPDEYCDGAYQLLDYKTYGSYKAGKLLGRTVVEVPSGETYRRKTTKRGVTYYPGQERMMDMYYFDSDMSEQDNEAWQLNTYRVGAQYQYDYTISSLMICVTLRDAGAHTRRTGFDRNIYMQPIRYIEDDEVLARAEQKQNAFAYAMEYGVMPEKCSDEETWNGIRCRDFCEVRHFCPYGGERAVLTEKEEV